ncbi:MAG: beta-N-acetylglucosaminidase, partial [Muribaculaceae bacterium]|nr:beta-N-acetylglucosaminidase [Muribaculaceae bacterium]
MPDTIHGEHDISAVALQWADSIMAEMTIEEMAGQLIMPAVYSDDSPSSIRQLRKYASDCHIGGVVLLKGTPGGASAIADTLSKLLPVAPFVAIDAEWGLAMRLEGTPEFPRNGHINPQADESLMFDYGREIAGECRETGINMVLGPVLDVLPGRSRRSGIGSRSFGKDPDRVARLGVAYARGLEAGGVISVAKHFPGHGSADADSHRRMPIVDRTRKQLDSIDLKPFREYIASGLSAVMTGHLHVPALDNREVPVTVSEKILNDFLKGELGFRGLIITDAINMAGASGYTAADAIRAGADMVLAPADTEAEVGSISAAVRSGSITVKTLRDRVRRVLYHKYMAGARESETENHRESAEATRIIKLLR